jgi:hypothetical protein
MNEPDDDMLVGVGKGVKPRYIVEEVRLWSSGAAFRSLPND